MRARNPRLVYGRMTGWGQSGPLAERAGHDINYIALAGVLNAIGRADEAPVPPLNLVGDFGGGGMLLAFGIACGVIEARASGHGQVVDAAMVDGAALLATMFSGFLASGMWEDGARGANVLDSGAPWYDTYATRDGKHVAIGAIEPQFYAKLLELTGLASEALPGQLDREQWPRLRERLRTVFRTRTRDAWSQLLEGSDACFAPVLTMAEAREHPANRARGVFVEVAGVAQPAPAPRFSRTPAAVERAPSKPAADTDAVLADWGFSSADIARLRDEKAVF